MAPTSSPPTTLASKNRVLIIGATGFMGKFLTEASLSSSHPTYLLIRPGGPLISPKSTTIKTFQEKGAIIVYVSYNINFLVQSSISHIYIIIRKKNIFMSL